MTMVSNKFLARAAKTTAAAAVVALLAGWGENASIHAQQVVAYNANTDYQKGKYSKVKHVLLYDYSCGGHNKTYILNSLTRLATQYGFRLDRGQTNSYITAATLTGVDVVVLSNGDCDVLQNSASLTAMRNFVEVQGKGILHSHAAAAYIPCPDENNLANANCRWQMKTLKTQFYQHSPDPTNARVFADSVKIGQIPARATGANAVASKYNHGLSNPETRMIFQSALYPLPVNGGTGATANQRHVWDGLGCEWYSYRTNPRLQDKQTIDGVEFGELNILLSLDESSITSTTCCRMGDRPASWTRKVGRGNAAYQNAGHSNIYQRARSVGGASVNDNLIEKYNWNLIRYLARDFVGCTDNKFQEYNPEASVKVLNAGLDEAEPCKTPNPTTLVQANERLLSPGMVKASRSALSVSLTESIQHQVLVTDVNGKSIFNGSAKGPKELEIPGLKSGHYIVKVTSATGDQVGKVEIREN